MHDTALSLGKLFFETYAPLIPGASLSILDVGSMDVNGSLREVAPPGARYLGLDVEAGKGVDAISEPGERFPFRCADFDLVVSTSCFEHDTVFWLTISEMLRVVRPGGFVYVNAPSNGIYHAHPLDCWRFYPDAGVALARWCDKWCDTPTELVESFVSRRGPSGWNDTVMVFGKKPLEALPARFMGDQIPSYNGRKRGLVSGLLRHQAESEDQQLIAYLAKNAGELLSRWVNLPESSPELDVSVARSELARDTHRFLETFGLTS